MKAAICPVFVLLLAAGESPGRFVKKWTYTSLREAADVVVLAKAVASVDTKEPWIDLKDHGLDAELGGVDTTFEVKAVLKGRPGERVVLAHHRFVRVGPVPLEDPPGLVAFRTAPVRVVAGERRVVAPAPDYLLYLKARPDGRFDPVSGYYDADAAVFEVTAPWSGRLRDAPK